MKTLCVLQHTEAEFLGFLEDHFESRSIRFRYARPFASGGVPAETDEFGGLVLLGAGPRGVVSGNILPSLQPELWLTREFLERGLPVFGFGTGACILAMAAGGSAAEAPFRFEVATARRLAPQALAGHLPPQYPYVVYMRDTPVLPPAAQVLATGESGEPALFQVADNCFGFLGHPGMKSAMIEDLIMEFGDAPDGAAQALQELRRVQDELVRALSEIVVGVIALSGLMRPAP